MELLLIFGAIWAVWFFFFRNNTTRNSHSGSQSFRREPGHDATVKTFKPTSTRHRQGASSAKNPISFKTSETGTGASKKTLIKCENCKVSLRVDSSKSGKVKCPKCQHINEIKSNNSVSSGINLDGILDAFSGVQVDPNNTLYNCACGVFYQTDSYELLAAENNSNCVACGNNNITLYSTQTSAAKNKAKQRARNHDPNAVTLSNYKDFVNQVVTFEGTVTAIKESRRGNDFAIMFENKSWTQGFKLVFFKGAARKAGGKRYINSLKGKKIQVRGLLIKHRTFGYEIIVNDKSMVAEL